VKFSTKMQQGSKSRDVFKWLHKQLLDAKSWALDVDLELVEKEPRPFIVARFDVKVGNDEISFSEAIAYSTLIGMPHPHRIPVYIVYADHLFKSHAENESLSPEDRKHLAKKHHRFTVKELISADYRPNPPKTKEIVVLENATWEDFGKWETQLRNNRKQEQRNAL
jgi:hypothetical protein